MTMKANEALVIVDYQNDFGNPNGSLYVKGGELLAPYINDMIAQVRSRAWVIISTQDWHPAGHVSFASRFGVPAFSAANWDFKWPDHCVAESWWADFLDWLDSRFIDERVYKWFDADVDSYSGFGWNEFVNGKPARSLDEILRERNIKVLNVLWLATEYCDLFTVRDALERGYEVNLLARWIKPVNAVSPDDGDKAIAEMRRLWAKIVL